MDFTPKDRRQLERHGIPLEEARRQLRLLLGPRRTLRLDRPCRLGDGILSLGEAEKLRLARAWDRARRSGGAAKFVPSSGAATRMFGALEKAARGRESPEARTVLAGVERLPFYPELGLRRDAGDREKLEALLKLAGGPKALLPFHRKGGSARTPLEEHLVEAAKLVKDGEGRCRIEFTATEDQLGAFRAFLRRSRPALERRLRARLLVAVSAQRPSTDTLAVGPEGRPFRLEDGRLLLRPGGHGALIENLAATKGGLVFVKNIDNVATERGRRERIQWEKALGGLLIELRDGAFGILSRLEAGAPTEEGLAFVRERLSLEPPEGGEARAWLADRLDRPFRVCGVVPNSGEPGGGPFWVRRASGQISPQIVESAEASPGQRALFASSTHFNPVDFACSLTDRRGRRYDLSRFVDPEAVFVAEKSRDGKPLRALERPGLWNGAMSGWNTVFVEIPGSTFNPVKTLGDLLRPAHQP